MPASEAPNAVLSMKQIDHPEAVTVEHDQLLALVYVLHGRVCDLEASNRQLREALGLDAPAPAIGADWKTIKQTAIDLGYTNCRQERDREPEDRDAEAWRQNPDRRLDAPAPAKCEIAV